MAVLPSPARTPGFRHSISSSQYVKDFPPSHRLIHSKNWSHASPDQPCLQWIPKISDRSESALKTPAVRVVNESEDAMDVVPVSPAANGVTTASMITTNEARVAILSRKPIIRHRYRALLPVRKSPRKKRTRYPARRKLSTESKQIQELRSFGIWGIILIQHLQPS